MNGKIAILGVFVADTTYRADRLPRMGETHLGKSFALGPGGKGSNQAVAAARAGGDVQFITRLGRDAFADMARGLWAEAGVAAHVIEDEDSYTGAAFIFVEDATGDNAIIIAPGAAGRITVDDVQEAGPLISQASVFVTQLEQPVPAAEAALAIAREAGVRTILNPAPAAAISDGTLALSDLVTPNESEAEGLTGVAVGSLETAEAAAQALMARGARSVIVTLGENGALFVDRDGTVHVPAFDAGPVVETTGAGDAFNGALAAALAEGQDPVQATRFGCAAAAISVTRPGTAGAMPTRAEIDALLQSR